MRLQSAIFNFQALLIVILLTICTCAYLRASPLQSIIDRNKTGYADCAAERVRARSAVCLLPPPCHDAPLSCCWRQSKRTPGSLACVCSPPARSSGCLVPTVSSVPMTLRLYVLCRVLGIFWKAARIGERLSPYVSGCCVAMAISVLFFT